jgi:hypothetical protein
MSAQIPPEPIADFPKKPKEPPTKETLLRAILETREELARSVQEANFSTKGVRWDSPEDLFANLSREDTDGYILPKVQGFFLQAQVLQIHDLPQWKGEPTTATEAFTMLDTLADCLRADPTGWDWIPVASDLPDLGTAGSVPEFWEWCKGNRERLLGHPSSIDR